MSADPAGPRRPGRLPMEGRDESIARMLAGESTPKAEAARLGCSYKTVQHWLREARRVQGASGGSDDAAARAKAAMGLGPAPAAGGAESEAPAGDEAGEQLTAGQLVAVSELALSVPIGLLGRGLGAPQETVDRLARFDRGEREMLLTLAPMAAPYVSSSLNRFPAFGAVIYGLGLGAIAVSHFAMLRAAGKAERDKAAAAAGGSKPAVTGPVLLQGASP